MVEVQTVQTVPEPGPPAVPPPTSWLRRWWWVLALVAGVVVVVVVVVAVLSSGRSGGSGGSGAGGGAGSGRGTVPALAGRTLPEADAALAAVGLHRVTGYYRFAGSGPSGTVLATEPAAGQTVASGGSVVVTVQVVVLGRQLQVAADILGGLGIAFATVLTSPAPLPERVVVGTEPEPGLRAAQSVRATLFVGGPVCRPPVCGPLPSVPPTAVG